MKQARRVFLTVLDSVGIGALPDAGEYGDAGSNTMKSIAASPAFSVPTLERLGLFAIDGMGWRQSNAAPLAAVARMAEASKGKDTTIGHWEICGIQSPTPLPTYPNGFPADVLDAFTAETGYGVLCNRPYSGTKVIEAYGEQHLRTGKLIVYTSGDSVFQIAAHEEKVPPEELYRVCRAARAILTGPHNVGRVIARPFLGTPGHFNRTPRRHDFSLLPPRETLLDRLNAKGLDVIAVGKINDIFAGQGITRHLPTGNNAEGMAMLDELVEEDFHGLCFTNLVDFDMVYGHRNDANGYAAALAAFDRWLSEFLPKLGEGDMLLITADHGCDPATPSTDHSREYTPMLLYGATVTPRNLGTRSTFADIGQTAAHALGTSISNGTSFWEDCV